MSSLSREALWYAVAEPGPSYSRPEELTTASVAATLSLNLTPGGAP